MKTINVLADEYVRERMLKIRKRYGGPGIAGGDAEKVAAYYFRRSGYRVLRSASGSLADIRDKIDLLCENENEVLAVQVKYNHGLWKEPVFPDVSWLERRYKEKTIKSVYVNVEYSDYSGWILHVDNGNEYKEVELGDI